MSIGAIVMAGAAGLEEECILRLLEQVPALSVIHVILPGAAGRLRVPASEKVVPHVVAGRENAVNTANRAVEFMDDDVVAFLDGAVVPRPGWAAALAWGAEAGADMMSGPVIRMVRGSPIRHDPEGKNVFLPFASTNLAVRRRVFTALGGFDPRLGASAGPDLCFRAQLNGYPLHFSPDAAVACSLSRSGAYLLGVRNAFDDPLLDWKYQQLTYQSSFPGLFLRRRWEKLTSLMPLWVMSGLDTRVMKAAASSICSPPPVAAVLAHLAGQATLLTGIRRAPAFLRPRSTREWTLSRPLGDPPLLVITGGPPRAVRALASLVDSETSIALAPPLEIEDLEERWDCPAPWSMWLARQARRCGWGVPQLLTARRIEQERPETMGEAILLLHAVYAWFQAKRTCGMTIPGGWIPRMSDACRSRIVVRVGNPRRGPAGSTTLNLSPSGVLCNPMRAVRRIEELVGGPARER